MRTFESGAIRDSDEGKLPYARALSPQVIKRYVQYMLKHNQTEDGTRSPDNWKNGFTLQSYMDSMYRHFMDVWEHHEKGYVDEEELCALMFNVMGYLHEVLKKHEPEGPVDPDKKVWESLDGIATSADSYRLSTQVADNAKRTAADHGDVYL